MAEKQQQQPLPATKGQPPEVALDTLNAELRTKRHKRVSHRRVMEAGIESKARKRRSSEGPVSSAYKPTG